MAKKIFLLFILVTLLAGSVFAKGHQDKYQSGSMLLGIDLGTGITPNIYTVTENSIPIGDYGFAFDLGVNFDYYMFKWLSLNSGLFVRPGMYLLLDKPITKAELSATNVTDWAKTPICFTVPVMAHLNVPKLDFLYAGAGVNLNFPVASILDGEPSIDVDTKGSFFLGIPIDIGFDFVKAGGGGSRFIFRVTPEIHHGGGTPVLIGFMWQLYNFRLRK